MAAKLEVTAQKVALAALIKAASTGLSIEEIATQANFHLDRRTLQRRLRQLLDDAAIAVTGRGPATRYTPTPPPSTTKATPSARPLQPTPQVAPAIKLSAKGAAILTNVARPIAARTPVGYNQAFLNDYQPNRSSYLTPTEKRTLAEINSTQVHGDAPAGTYAQQILNRLLIDLSWNSSRLEGNTYSLLDTERLLEAGQIADGTTAIETQMILNHKAAIELLVQSADQIRFNRYTILNLHALLAENLLPNPRAAGRVRSSGVGIRGSVFHPLEGPPQRLQQMFDTLLAKADAIEDPYEQAFFIMVQLPYLQPFEDINKRTSRLAANIPFVRLNLSPLAFIDVPDALYISGILGVYELNRIDLLKDVFLWAYQRSANRFGAIRQSIGEPDLFRLHHRLAIKDIIATVMRTPMDQRQATRHIAAWSKANLPKPEQARFIEVVETELLDVHDGNFARFQIRPAEFAAWQSVWSAVTPPPAAARR
jgi:Fic/DOC family